MTAVRSFEELLNENVSLNEQLHEKDEKIVHLEEELAWFKRQIFGKKSERIVTNLNQEQLTLEGFEPPAPKEEGQANPDPVRKRRKPNRNGQDKIKLPSNLPVQTIILD